MARSAAKTCRWCRPRQSRPGCARASPQAEMRRDYELALQIGNKDALNAFLAQYPDGFYASLAKFSSPSSPPRKPASPPPKRRGRPNRSGRGSPPRARKRAQQAKAEADAKAAEQARIAAEKAKQIAQEQAAAAEQKRAREPKIRAPTARRADESTPRGQGRQGRQPCRADRGPAGADVPNRCRPSCAASAVSSAAADGNGTRRRSVR